MPTRNSLSGVALVVAVVSIVAWLGFTIYLMRQTDSQEPNWTRMVWVFGSVQAIAFAAAGALFGTAVQRDRATAAETRAKDAETVAAENQQAATNGRALAAAIQAEEPTAAPGSRGLAPQGAGAGQVDETRERHARLARTLFGVVGPAGS